MIRKYRWNVDVNKPHYPHGGNIIDVSEEAQRAAEVLGSLGSTTLNGVLSGSEELPPTTGAAPQPEGVFDPSAYKDNFTFDL